MHRGLERLVGSYASYLMSRSFDALEIHLYGDLTRWNARQIVEHLILTYQSSSSVFRERLNKGRPTQSRPRPYQRIQQFFVCQCSYFPTGRLAPIGVIPEANASEVLDGDSLAAKLDAELRSMDQVLVVCEEQFGEKRFASHQVLGPLSAKQWRKFHIAHGRSHLKQLWRIDRFS